MSRHEDTNVLYLFVYHRSHGSPSLSKAMAIPAAGFEKSFFGIHGTSYDLFTNLVFECSCSLCVTVIQFLFLLRSGSHILALIALVVEFSAFSTNLLQEKRGLLVFAGLIWCRVGEKQQDWSFTFFTKQNWKKQIIASICVVLGIFGGYVHVFQYAQSLREETIKEGTTCNWNRTW